MHTPSIHVRCFSLFIPLVMGVGLVAVVCVRTGSAHKSTEAEPDSFAVRPLIQKYCLECHSTKRKKGSLDLERFVTRDDLRKDVKVWEGVIEQLEAGEMPPKGKLQPSAAEKKQIIAWLRSFLDTEAKANSGDPGSVPLRRLSNAEYDYTIHDLTGIDLKPTREFPADGAAGEGFTNAAEALTDISPALFTKYLNAAKNVADHAVLLPDGFRFSATRTRRDWTDESLAHLRAFYARFVGTDGKLPVQRYLTATIRHRDALLAGTISLDQVAINEKLNSKYLTILWKALTDQSSSPGPLNAIRAKWRSGSSKDVPALMSEIASWQAVLWKFTAIGSYRFGATHRQLPNDPPAVASQTLRTSVKLVPGTNEVTLYLSSRDVSRSANGNVVWSQPRFEVPNQAALLLRDYDQFGPAYEVDYPSVFANTSHYLCAAVDLANDKKLTIAAVAQARALDADFLTRWVELLGVEPFLREVGSEMPGRFVPSVVLELLDEKTPKIDTWPAISGWRKKGTQLPVLVTNASDHAEQIPGRVDAKGVSVHPMPKEFVAVAWTAPIAGRVHVRARITHAHPACGNGVAWWLELRRGKRASLFAEGATALGGTTKAPDQALVVQKGDQIILAVDAKDGSHICDMTAIEFTVNEEAKPKRVWNLAADIATTVQAGNPHADSHGHEAVWSFVRGPSRPLGTAAPLIPSQSLLGKWREAAANPKRQAEAALLAKEVQSLLSGKQPTDTKSVNRTLYDNLVSVKSVLFTGIDPMRLGKRSTTRFGLPKKRFRDADLVSPANGVIAIKLPAALFVGRTFAVTGKLDSGDDRVVQFQLTTKPTTNWDTKSPFVASPHGAEYKRLVQGFGEFRRIFPSFVCFPAIVPVDEVVNLKMFHREDAELARLFLSESDQQKLDHLWLEHRFISRQPVAENDYLPQFIGFVTQDQPTALLRYFESQRPVFQKRADDFLKEEEAAITKQLNALLEFAARAYRRPLREDEKTDLTTLYRTVRSKGAAHPEAFRGVLARVLVSPAFLFRIEQAPTGQAPAPVNDWELATRLSYFLWSSMPDDELRRCAAAGQLRDPKVLAAQTRRMINDPRTRALAIEFGTQWLHVRGFDSFNEKNEKVFPSFNEKLRGALYEESILFFLDLFQSDRPVRSILDADYTFLNDLLAKHYGIPGVSGPQWRRVEGVRKYGRGGILTLGSVQSKQAGASRTSPILRGNWVVETLLGERLPRPPANIPQLPEMEGTGNLTVRQLVEKHVSDPSCAVCHVRVDPFGFALENYDAIGRYREKDLSGRPVDTRAKLKDGTTFQGIEGLRTYLLTKKHDVVVRLFCRRLLGYALGRAVTLSDTVLLNEMTNALNANDGHVIAAVQVIVNSPQFRMVRGRSH